MSGAFNGSGSLLGFSAADKPDLRNVTDMSAMFANAASFNGNISGWDTKNVTNMNLMFYRASSFNQPIGSWNTANVTSMVSVFNGASAFNQPLNNWNTSHVTNLYEMFRNATYFDQPINNWDVSKVTNMAGMFRGAASFNQPLSAWSTSNNTNMSFILNGASSFNQPLGNWNISKVAQLVDSLSGSALSVKNYDLTINGWPNQIPKSNAKVGANGLKYCASASSRQLLITTYNWTFTGDLQDCGPAHAAVGGEELTGAPTIASIPTFTGTATPGATIEVTVRSDPIVCTATADINGSWSCTLPSGLQAGSHTVTVIVTDPGGSIQQLGPYIVNVTGQHAATIDNETVPNAPDSGARPQTNGLLLMVSLVGLSVLAASARLMHQRN